MVRLRRDFFRHIFRIYPPRVARERKRESVKVTALKKLRKPAVGKCTVCRKAAPLEFLDADTGLILCNECAGHFAVAEYWLYRFKIDPCTSFYNERGDESL